MPPIPAEDAPRVALPASERDGRPPTTPRAALTAVVLCGGESRRMGRDKARLELGGRTLLERAVAAVEPLAAEVVLACGARPRYAELGLPLALDEAPGLGPLAGLAAGLAAARTEWVLAVGCDMPGLAPALFTPLLAAAQADPQADVVLWVGEDGPEPLCALYRRPRVEPAVRAALAAGERRLVSFWERAPLAVVRIAKEFPSTSGARGLEGRADPFRNLNTPEDVVLEQRARDERGAGPGAARAWRKGRSVAG